MKIKLMWIDDSAPFIGKLPMENGFVIQIYKFSIVFWWPK